MDIDNDGTVHLTTDEAEALARHLVALHLCDRDDCIQWEDVPLLDEASWEAVDDMIDDIAVDMRRALYLHERAVGVDARHLLERSFNDDGRTA